MPNEKGFYLTTTGRKAYHEMLATCCGNVLFDLKLISKLEIEASKPLDRETFRMTLGIVASLCQRGLHFAYTGPLLGIHLRWLLTISAPAASKHTPKPTRDLFMMATKGARHI